MVSNQVLQNTIEGIRDITHLEICVMDAEGREVASTAPVFADAVPVIPDFALSPADSQSAGPFQFFKVLEIRRGVPVWGTVYTVQWDDGSVNTHSTAPDRKWDCEIVTA